MKIENEFISLEVSEKAGEMHSLFDKQKGLEMLWDGNPDVWSGRNPTLFPMVGSTKDKIIRINGKEYTMGNHGFCRNSTFTCTNHDQDSITMTLEDNEETFKQYPFHFSISITYTLVKNRVEISYLIVNKDEIDMPFHFGLHPAFKCPVKDGEKFEDYYLEFSNNETLKGILGPYGLNNERVIPLNYPVFDDNPTICFEYPKSSFVDLTNGKDVRLRVNFVGYRWLAFWTKPNAKYICIEPWHSHSDFEPEKLDIAEREGAMVLKSQRSFTTAYIIEII